MTSNVENNEMPPLTAEKGSTPVGSEDANGEEKTEYITGFRLISILAAGTLVQFVMMLDQSIIATAVPWITNDFHSLLDVGWYGSAYQLASASFQPLAGKLYTHLQVKWTFITFFLIFELGSLLCAVATSSTMLIVARAIAGLGASGLLNGGMTMISACLPKHKRPAAMGMIISIGQLGQASGPLIGGALTQYVTWRWCFYINLPIGGVVLGLLSFLSIPEPLPKRPVWQVLSRPAAILDLVGFALFAPSAIMFFLGLQYGGNQYSWDSATVLGLLIGGAANFAVFLAWEHRMGEEAMIPLYMLKKRIVWSSCFSMFFITGVLTGAAYYLPLYFQAVLGSSPIMSGVYYLPNVLMQITLAMVTGILVQRLGYYLPFIMFGTALASIGYGCLSMLTPSFPTARRVGLQIVAGTGIGTASTIPFIAVQNVIPHAHISVAMAILVFALNFGGATFLTVVQTAFSQSLRASLPKYAPGVDVAALTRAGATDFRSVVPSKLLDGVLMAYSVSIDHVFYVICSAAAAAFVFSSGMGWEDIRKYRPKAPESTLA